MALLEGGILRLRRSLRNRILKLPSFGWKRPKLALVDETPAHSRTTELCSREGRVMSRR